jgi:hypothetical protein
MEKRNHKLYRKIYEQHHGPIPIDSDGRTFDIHHKDGDSNNNDPTNLVALSIQEHYDVHYAQNDWGACLIMSERMKISPEERSRLSSESNKINHQKLGLEHPVIKNNIERLLNGTHNLLGDSNPVHKMIDAGTHHWLGGELQRNQQNKRVEDGVHQWLGGDLQKKWAAEQIKAGTHIFVGDSNPSKLRSKAGTHHFLGESNPVHKQLANGTHNFLGKDSIIKEKWECKYCGKIGVGRGMFNRWHGDNCKKRT